MTGQFWNTVLQSPLSPPHETPNCETGYFMDTVVGSFSYKYLNNMKTSGFTICYRLCHQVQLLMFRNSHRNNHLIRRVSVAGRFVVTTPVPLQSTQKPHFVTNEIENQQQQMGRWRHSSCIFVTLDIGCLVIYKRVKRFDLAPNLGTQTY